MLVLPMGPLQVVVTDTYAAIVLIVFLGGVVFSAFYPGIKIFLADRQELNIELFDVVLEFIDP